MQHTQVNVRLTTKQSKDLHKSWLKYNQDHEEDPLTFNAYVAWLLTQNRTKVSQDPLSPKVEPGSSFIDDRGVIQNILNENITAVALITSKKGSVRSNHYHNDWHYLYVISGKMEYHERTLDGSRQKVLLVSAGEMVFTAPGLVHKTVFLEDTLLLSLGNYTDHDAATVKQEF